MEFKEFKQQVANFAGTLTAFGFDVVLIEGTHLASHAGASELDQPLILKLDSLTNEKSYITISRFIEYSDEKADINETRPIEIRQLNINKETNRFNLIEKVLSDEENYLDKLEIIADELIKSSNPFEIL